MRTFLTLSLAVSLLPIGIPGEARAASPPQRLNYEGVLRDANGNPLSGNYSMIFRLEESTTGDEILIDEHSGGAAGSGVDVTNGVFNVAIGSGNVMDGAGPGSYTSLAEVFRDFSDVQLSVEVEGEVLSPAIPVGSTPFSLNATHLSGLDPGQFLRADVSGLAAGNIWFSASPTGSSINDATVLIKPITANLNQTLFGVGVSLSEKFRVDAEGDTFIGGTLVLPNGAQVWNTPSGVEILGGDQDSDDVVIRAGNTSDDGEITINGSEEIKLRAGNGHFLVRDASDNGGRMIANDLGLMVAASEEQTDSLQLLAGFGTLQGSVEIDGAGPITLSAGNDRIQFRATAPFDPVYLVGNTDGDMVIQSDKSLIHYIDADGWLDGDAADVQWFHQTEILGGPLTRQLAEIQETGDLRILGQLESNAGFDLAESFVMAEPVGPGDLVSVDSQRSDSVRLAVGAGDTAVIGVVSTRPGIRLGGAPFEATSMESLWGGGLRDEFLERREELRQEVLGSQPGLRRRLERIPKGETEVGPGGSEERRLLAHELDDRALERFFDERVAPVALAGRVPVKVDAGYGSIRVGDLLTPSPTPGHAMRADDPLPGTVVGKALESLDSGEGIVMVLVMLR